MDRGSTRIPVIDGFGGFGGFFAGRGAITVAGRIDATHASLAGRFGVGGQGLGRTADAIAFILAP